MLNSKFNLYNAEWLDVVFTDRNKSYGAYDLRLHYGRTMARALAITVFGFAVAATTLTIVFKHNKDTADNGPVVVDITPIKPPPIKDEPVKAELKKDKPVNKPIEKIAAAPKPNIPMQRVLPPVAAPDELVKTEVKPIDPNIAIGPIDNKGDGKEQSLNATAPVGPGGDGTAAKGEPEGSNEPYDAGTLDVMPEPYGGTAAWSRFLQKNLRYPNTDVQGRVIISFIIERDGKLTDLQVIKGVASELDREALRVLKLAPAWKPGLQGGKPVRVKYTIPIVFQVQE